MGQGKIDQGVAFRRWGLCLGVGLFLILSVLANNLQADPPDCPPPCPPAFPAVPVPEKGPRPATGPGSLAAFIDNVSNNDSAFEVIVGEGRILTAKVDLAVAGKRPALVAVGDPSVLDFTIINVRQIRVVGRRTGVTDLSIMTGDNQTYSFEVRVVAALDPLRGKLCQLFPDASLKLVQVRDHIAVEGQARDVAQVNRILETIHAYLKSVEIGQLRKIMGQQFGAVGGQPKGVLLPGGGNPEDGPAVPIGFQQPQQNVQGTIALPQVINLIRVPGSQQVLLKVCVAELNRTALRQVGTDFLVANGNLQLGSQLGVTSVNAAGLNGTPGGTAAGLLQGIVQSVVGNTTTLFGVFDRGDFAVFFSALRRNSLVKILAEPNLVALNGHKASFLAGGQFPYPIPQSGAGGGPVTITVAFKDFGVQLAFTPTILDGETIRLAVEPEVSTLDYSIGVVLVPGGAPVPGLNTRKTHTVVELREGQTLALAGLLSVELDAQTNRIPGLGDLPILGPFFSNTANTRTEKELLVLVTPYLAEPMAPHQVPPVPGANVTEPTDLEFYLANRIEGRTGRDFRSTVSYDLQSPLLQSLFRLDGRHVAGPVGYCE